MRTLQHLTVGMGLVLLAACTSTDSKLPIPGNNLAVNAPPAEDDGFKLQPANTILSFLQWYRHNVTRIKQIEMVSPSTDPKMNGAYAVNFTATEQYLDELKKSGFVSDKYIANWRDYFKQADEKLKKSAQREGSVKEFDKDFIMWAKDYTDDLNHIEKSTVEYQKAANDEGIVMIGLPTVGRVKYKISKQNGKWLIDDIKDMRSALDQAQND
jgi:hypothetical protein